MALLVLRPLLGGELPLEVAGILRGGRAGPVVQARGQRALSGGPTRPRRVHSEFRAIPPLALSAAARQVRRGNRPAASRPLSRSRRPPPALVPRAPASVGASASVPGRRSQQACRPDRASSRGLRVAAGYRQSQALPSVDRPGR